MMERDEADRIIRSKLQQILDELNNHITRESYEKLHKEQGKIVGLILKAAGL